MPRHDHHFAYTEGGKHYVQRGLNGERTEYPTLLEARAAARRLNEQRRLPNVG